MRELLSKVRVMTYRGWRGYAYGHGVIVGRTLEDTIENPIRYDICFNNLKHCVHNIYEREIEGDADEETNEEIQCVKDIDKYLRIIQKVPKVPVPGNSIHLAVNNERAI